MVQIRGAKKGLSTHTRTHLHLPRRCRYARRSCAELACSAPGTGTAPHGAAPSPPPPHPVLPQMESLSKAYRKKTKTEHQTSSAFHPLLSYASARREVPAGSVLQGTRDAGRGARCRRAELAGPRSWQRSRPPAPGGHRAPRPAAATATPGPSGTAATGNLYRAAAAAHIGLAGRDGAERGGTGRGLRLKGHGPFPTAAGPCAPERGGPCAGCGVPCAAASWLAARSVQGSQNWVP